MLDPRPTETARLASRHLSPRSGTDFSVLGHVVRELLRDAADTAYLATHARHLDELHRAVERFDARTTADMTGLASEDLRDLVAAVRRHRRLAIVTGTGVTMAATGNVTEWMAYALQIVTGSFERSGGRWFNHGATVVPSTSTAPDSSGFGPGPKSHPEIPRLANQFPCAVMPAEIKGGHLKAMLVTGGNPLTAFPQPERLGRALVDHCGGCDASVPLPRPSRAGRPGCAHQPLESLRPVHAAGPPASRQPASHVVELGKVGSADGCLDPARWRRPDSYSDEELFASMVAGTRVSWDALRSADGRPVEYPAEDRWVERTVLPDRRWELAHPLLVNRLEDAMSRPAHELVLGNRREVRHTNSTLTWSAPGAPVLKPYVYLNPADAAPGA